MNRRPGLRPLFLLSLFAWATFAPAASAAPGDSAPTVAASSNAARARQLAADVAELAGAPGMARAKREKRIATAVRTAVVAATAYRQDSGAALGAASELAAAATSAAPAYAEVIIKAAAFAPGVAQIDGSAGAIRAAALAAPKRGKATRVAAASARPVPATRKAAPAARPAPRMAEPVVAETEPSPAGNEDTAVATPAYSGVEEDARAEARVRRGRHPVDDPAVAFSVTLETAARYDDNIFQSATNKVHDTIISAKPGVEMRWGDKSQSHGHVGYTESFEHYADGTAPNVSLGNGAFGYVFEGAASSGTADAGYSQVYQTNNDLLATGQGALVRTNTLSAAGSFEAHPWAKIGGSLGASYAKTEYKFPGLIGNTQVGVPFSVLFALTPKTDLSAGYSFSTQRPDGGGGSSKDHYLNVGARGEFTPKLSGSFNVGYQLRKVGANPDEHMVAFSGNFAYELTPRTNLTLGATRNFNASSVGASTKNTAVRLGLASTLSPQFSLGASVAWSDNQYGAAVFRDDLVQPAERTDHLWEGSLSATYLFTDWFTTTAAYNFRNNSSTTPSVEYSGNVLSLMLGLKY